MTTIQIPATRPVNPNFSSGPCSKRPGWSLDALSDAFLGRSHRAKPGKARLKRAIDSTKEILRVPEDYVCGIMPGSDTGAFEAAMWTMLGARGVDILAWESFGSGWVTDAVKQLKLDDLRVHEADLTMVDATSAVFAQDVDWPKADVLTFSWQKVMGGEAAHGMLILSPRAVARLESYAPPRPLPKIFRLAKGGELIAGIFDGATINTPSMLALEDYLDALAWGEGLGGQPGLKARADANAAVLFDWIDATPWADNLAVDPAIRSNTSVCISISDSEVAALDSDGQAAFAKKMVSLLDAEGVAYDIGSYRDAPPGLRIWCGATVETSDLEALTPWLGWAFAEAKASLA